MALLFISNLVPDREEYRNDAFARSGNNVQLGIAGNLPDDTELWSCPPVPSYPRGKSLKRGRIETLPNGSKLHILPVLNIKFIKSIYWGILCFNKIILWRIKHHNEKCIVITYNNDPPPFEYLFAACRLSGAKFYAILYDLGVPPVSLNISHITRLAYSYMDRIAHFIIKRLDGRIVINERIVQDYAPGKDYLLIDGGIGENILKQLFPLKTSQNKELVLVLAGMLWEQNGTKLVLEMLKLYPDLMVKVMFAGKGQDVPAIVKAAVQDNRIEYLGILTVDELFKVYESADVLLNLRIEEEVDYHFPSKLLEYLATGKCVISTPTAHAQRDYGKYLNILDDISPTGLYALICEISNINKDTLFIHSIKQRNFMLENRTWSVRTREILSYIYKNEKNE